MLYLCSAAIFAQENTQLLEINDPSTNADEDGEEEDGKKTEVLLILDARAIRSSVEDLKSREQTVNFYTQNYYLRKTKLSLPTQLHLGSIEKFMIDITNENISYSPNYISAIDFNSTVHKTLFLETIMKMGYTNTFEPGQLAIQVSQLIENVYDNDESRYDFLSLMSERLYANYNNARNPFRNNDETNPNNIALPETNMTLADLFKAAFEKNKFGGGVCNDIAQAIAEVGQPLFPDLDVLVISGGTHIGTIFTDGETTRLIDGGQQMITKNMITLHENVTNASNIRVMKVVDSKLREIAIIDTEQGQLVSSALDLNRATIATNWPMQKIIGQIKNVINTNERKKETMMSLATANLSRSSMVVLAGKLDFTKKNNHVYMGAAIGIQSPKEDQKVHSSKGSIHIALGYEKKFVLYAHPSLKIDYTPGVHAQGNFGTSMHIYDSAGTLDLQNSIQVKYQPKSDDTLNVDSKVTLVNSIGPKSYGDTTGQLSKFKIGELPKILLGMRFHVNQLVLDTKVEKKINSNLSAQGTIFYQGTNVGQNLESSAGVTIQTDNDKHKFYVYVGYDNSELKGYMTQHNIIAGYTGGKVGANYQNKKGSQFEFSVRELGLGNKNPNFTGTLKIPFQYTENAKKEIPKK